MNKAGISTDCCEAGRCFSMATPSHPSSSLHLARSVRRASPPKNLPPHTFELSTHADLLVSPDNYHDSTLSTGQLTRYESPLGSRLETRNITRAACTHPMSHATLRSRLVETEETLSSDSLPSTETLPSMQPSPKHPGTQSCQELHGLISTLSASHLDASSTFILPKDTLPIVIPQTSRALRGVYFSPFLRAYPETLGELGISKGEFIHFIDDLNEAFIASPFFYALMIASTAVSFVPEPAAQITGGVVASVTNFASNANSHLRTKIFVKSANKELFARCGLQARILSTAKMLEAIHFDGKIELPPLPDFNDPESEEEQGDPRRRWMQALQDRVAPLDYRVPGFSQHDNWLKRAGAWTAKHQDKRQEKTILKRREKAKKKAEAVHQEATRNEQMIEGTIEGLKMDLAVMRNRPSADPTAELKRLRNIADCEKAILLEQSKYLEETVKKHETTEKLVTKVEKKESKVVQKIRWVVITAGVGSEVDDEDINDGVEDDYHRGVGWPKK